MPESYVIVRHADTGAKEWLVRVPDVDRPPTFTRLLDYAQEWWNREAAEHVAHLCGGVVEVETWILLEAK